MPLEVQACTRIHVRAITVSFFQVGGIRFLYDNIVESRSRHAASSGFGCILAHSMGLGKTLQMIAFIDIFFRHMAARHVLCVVPVNTLQNWVNEFDKWLPGRTDEGSNGGGGTNGDSSSQGMAAELDSAPEGKALADDSVDGSCLSRGNGTANQCSFITCGGVKRKQDITYRSFHLFLMSDNARSMEARLGIIAQWRSEGGVLLIGYEMYRLLSLSIPSLGGNKMATKRKKRPAKVSKSTVIDLDETEKEMDALIGE